MVSSQKDIIRLNASLPRYNRSGIAQHEFALRFGVGIGVGVGITADYL